jgi:uncharacterized protein YjbI with pentapeptide repeats
MAPLETEVFHYFGHKNNNQKTISTWITVNKDRSVLTGDWREQKLGTVNLTGSQAAITATLTVNPRDIFISEIEGLWRHDISPNKHGVLERKLAFFLFQNHCNPYVSLVELTAADSNTPTGETLRPTIPGETGESVASLVNLINRVYGSTTDDFLALAQLAHLNPLTDFPGANLVGSNLSGADLGGANLCHANLRGADLTDADLSEADLSYAKLGGADLSGAYLESANLSYSDFHRASLALANLIAVDLSGANLLGTNLSNANLSSSEVAGAVFGDNPGLSEEEKQGLIQRGAIFA